MINNKTNSICFRVFTLLLTLVILCSSLISCRFLAPVAQNKDEIIGNIADDLSKEKDRKYVSDYLRNWGLPKYDTIKFIYMENYFISYYNYEDGLPDRLTHAQKTADLFLNNYYDKISRSDKEAVTDALLSCYVYALDDPYAVYRPPVQTEEFNTDMSGKFGGIGVMVEQNYTEKTIRITAVLPDSPAEKSGVKNGDYIHAIDGKTVEELGIENAVDHVRGQVGTTVHLTLIRDGAFVNCSVVRELVEENNAYYEFDSESKIGYVTIVQFKDNTAEQFKKCIDELTELKAEGIIFDLRGNPGGYVYSVCEVISYLIPTGKTIMSYQYKGYEPYIYTSSDDAEGYDHTVDLPFVVICDEYTASAGEIFTAAIRDYRNEGMLTATIVGTTTYKKGIMQSSFYYPVDNSTVTFTVAYYNPPCGVNYHGIGITPDVEIENTSTEDLQLNAAYEEIKKLLK